MTDTTAFERIRTVSLVLLATGAACAGLYWFSTALIPFVIAALFHFSLAPLISWQRRKFKFPRWLAITTTALLGLLVFAAMWTLVIASVSQIANNYEVYQERLVELADRAIQWVPLQSVGMSENELRDAIAELPSTAARTMLPGTVGTVMSLLSQGTLVFLFLLFMLAGKGALPGKEPDLLDEVEAGIQKYVVTKFFLSALTGILTWAILAVLGIEFAMVFGVLAFMLNFIPNVGSTIASLLPIPVVLLGDYSIVTSLLAIALPAGTQFTIGNIVEPKVMGDSLNLHPAVVLLALVLFGVLWGIPGMFLATPLTGIIKIVCEKREFTLPLARLLEGDLSVLNAPGKDNPDTG